MKTDIKAVDEILTRDKAQVLREWMSEVGRNADEHEASELLESLHGAIRAGADPDQLDSAAWSQVLQTLGNLSQARAAQGSSAGETSHFILALKRPLFNALQTHFSSDVQSLMAAVWALSTMVDKLAQWTVTAYQRSREEVIARQQQELLELSTPVVKLWDGVLAVPMIGTLDSGRTQLVMESLLQRIVDTGSELAIIDITGVPTVDTLVAQHLLKTVTAIRLMGADCIISGIRPQIAQTVVHLGIDLKTITTKATLHAALALALKKSGFTVSRSKPAAATSAASATAA
ncbi:STAS domain-containing protein [Paucibacter sp. R3-3]|uniref:STAS domain-containing protein n=1 Tax=Roseateles agri TaxID=3098619 RepID=A0ABU5DQL0_9BURK|nr:STAS domain-containing protein [Paucibacter sp. R3-3]MDY0748613.1 STAS domain-containing protein [Paucibacter sp. R3-3]